MSQGELIAGVSGLVLLIVMFFDWYGVKVKTALGSFGGGLGGPNAWQSFSLIDLLLFLTILIVVGVAVMRGLSRMPEMPYPPATLVAIAGIVAFLLVLFRLIVQPFDVPDGVDVTRKLGIWLGLLASAGMAYGGWRAMQEAGTSFGDLTAGGAAAAGGAATNPTAPTTPMPATDPGVPGGGEAGVSPGKEGPGVPHPGTSTGAPGEEGGGPAPAPAAADPVPGETAGQTTPGLAGEPPREGGTQPPGL